MNFSNIESNLKFADYLVEQNDYESAIEVLENTLNNQQLFKHEKYEVCALLMGIYIVQQDAKNLQKITIKMLKLRPIKTTIVLIHILINVLLTYFR